MGKQKVVLAFSGGLDTSFCVKYLSEDKGYDVYTAIANTGGFSKEELANIEKRALALGAVKHATLDIEQEYYEKSIKYMIYGDILRNGTYPISVSSERIFQAIAIIEYAKSVGADCVAHGSTGAGNDQVRFDLTFQVLAPEIEIITPTRDMTLTREYEINYLREHGFEADFKKMEYSINKGLWGTSIGGKETLRSEQTLPEEAYPSQVTAHAEERLKITFHEGEIAAVNGKPYADKVEAIRAVEAIGSKFGIGRDMHIGDTIIGIKGRVGFEAAAPMLIIAAHRMLEKHTQTKWQIYWKEQVANWYGMFLHEAQYLEPVMRDIEAMLASSQRNVTGTVELILRPYSYTLVGVDSTFDLMKTDFGEYGEVNKAWTADDVKGFTKILGNQIKITTTSRNATRNDPGRHHRRRRVHRRRTDPPAARPPAGPDRLRPQHEQRGKPPRRRTRGTGGRHRNASERRIRPPGHRRAVPLFGTRREPQMDGGEHGARRREDHRPGAGFPRRERRVRLRAPRAEPRPYPHGTARRQPGCFATAIQLALLPLAAAGLLTDEVHVTAVTGSTGAGVKPSATTHFSWRSDNISVYKAFTHQHLVEIGRNLRRLEPSSTRR